MFERFNRSWALAKQTFGVMRNQPTLALFPIISGIATLFVSLSFLAPIAFSAYQSGMFESGAKTREQIPIWYYIVSFCYYLVSYFVVVFFNVALIHCASKALRGEKTSVGEGISVAKSRLGPILGWSLIAATVGTILKAISERVGIVGQIIVALLGGAWNIVTFFVVPSLALEGIGPVSAINSSFETIKKAWGETLIGNVGISYAMGFLSLLPIPMIIAACFTQSVWVIVAAIGLAVVVWLGIAILSSCLQGIYTAAVFEYARTGSTPSAFSAQQMQEAFLPKPDGMVSNYMRRNR
ncbi:MAG: DUF6159 family protein [Armatimonadota bacterium]